MTLLLGVSYLAGYMNVETIYSGFITSLQTSMNYLAQQIFETPYATEYHQHLHLSDLIGMFGEITERRDEVSRPSQMVQRSIRTSGGCVTE
jgi:hypothetical protein